MSRALRAVAICTAMTFAATSAGAADLPSIKAPPSPLSGKQPYSWTGVYAGVNFGFATDRYEFPYAFVSAATGAFPGRGAIYSSGVIGGGQIGFNYQTPWKIVVGLEVEAEASSVGGRLPIRGPGVYGEISTGVPLYGAFRLRLGYAFDRFLFLDNVMVYLAMGGAFGSFHDRMFVVAGPNVLSYYQATTRLEVSKSVGSLGIGVAHAINKNLSVFADYRYTALGPEWGQGRQITIHTPTVSGTFGTRAMYHLGRIGLNWKFDWPSL